MTLHPPVAFPFTLLTLCGLLVVPSVAAAGPPAAGRAVGGVAKPADQPPDVPAVPGPGDRMTKWQQAAALPWVEAVDVPKLKTPDGEAREGAVAVAPVMVLDRRREEYETTLSFGGGQTIVLLQGDLPDGPAAADYARLALTNADRLRRVRPQLPESSGVRAFQQATGRDVLLGPEGEHPVVNYVELSVRPDPSTPDPDDVLVAVAVSFNAAAERFPRIVIYDDAAGAPPEGFERWVWRAPADDPAPPADGGGEAADRAAKRPAALATTAPPDADPAAPRFVRTRQMSGEGLVMMGLL